MTVISYTLLERRPIPWVNSIPSLTNKSIGNSKHFHQLELWIRYEPAAMGTLSLLSTRTKSSHSWKVTMILSRPPLLNSLKLEYPQWPWAARGETCSSLINPCRATSRDSAISIPSTIQTKIAAVIVIQPATYVLILPTLASNAVPLIFWSEKPVKNALTAVKCARMLTHARSAYSLSLWGRKCADALMASLYLEVSVQFVLITARLVLQQILAQPAMRDSRLTADCALKTEWKLGWSFCWLVSAWWLWQQSHVISILCSCGGQENKIEEKLASARRKRQRPLNMMMDQTNINHYS